MNGLVVFTILMQVICVCLADDGAVSTGTFQFRHEDFMGLSSIRVRAKNLPAEYKCAAYLNKLRESNAGADDASLIESAVGAIEQGKGQWKNSQFLLDDLRECQKLASSVGILGKEKEPGNVNDRTNNSETLGKELDELRLSVARYKDELAEVRKQLEDERESSSELSSDLNAKQSKINAVEERCRRQRAEFEKEIHELRRDFDSAGGVTKSGTTCSYCESQVRKLKKDLKLASEREWKLRLYLGDVFYNDALGKQKMTIVAPKNANAEHN